MLSLFFWKNWSRENKILYLVLAGVFVFATIFLLALMIIGADTILNWESLVQSTTVDTLVGAVSEYPFTLDVKADSVIFFELFGGSDVEVSPVAYYLFLTAFAVSMSFLISVSTYLSRFWYTFVSVLFVLVLILFKFDLLLLFGSSGKWGLVVLLALILPASYFFQSFREHTPLYVRFLVFTLLFSVFGIIVYFFSEVPNPFMQIAVYGIAPSIILTLIFIILVSHDIIAGFLNAVTYGASGSGNWKHFFLISGIYLVNVLILYLNEIGAVDWNLFPLNTFVLLILSVWIGIWGFKQREPQYDYLIPFYPLGAVFYMAGAILAFSTLAFFHATGNDPVIDVIQDVVIYSHLGYGVIFLMYILSNFLSPLTQNLQVYKILYKPDVMPYFTFRLAGLLAFGALVFVQNWKIPYHKSIAGYYNALGDLYTNNGDYLLATGYFDQASDYGRGDHRSNYSLAVNAMKTEDVSKAIYYYDRSNFSYPTEYAYANLGNIYFGQKRYFDAVFELKSGLKKFPESGPLMNNLGVLYTRLELYDSAYMYFQKALQIEESSTKARNNILALLAESETPSTVEDIRVLVDPKDEINSSNFYALVNTWGEGSDEPLDLEASELNQFNHSAIYNYLINNRWRPDTLAFEVINNLDEENLFFERRLVLAKAINYYYKGVTGKAIDMLKGLRYGERFWSGKIEQILGIWHLENGDLEGAIGYFESAKNNYHPDGLTSYAISLTLGGRFDEALVEWDSLAKTPDPPLEMISSVTRIIKLNKEEISSANDHEKYQWLIFQPENSHWEVAKSLSDNRYFARYALFKARKYMTIDQPEEAWSAMNRISDNVPDEGINLEIARMNMTIAARLRNSSDLASYLDAGFEPLYPTTKSYYQALLALSRSDSATAEALFEESDYSNPYAWATVIDVTEFYEAKGEREKAYFIIQAAAASNPNSIPLQKAYIGICGRMGLDTFGYDILQRIADNMPPTDFLELKNQFEYDLAEFLKIE